MKSLAIVLSVFAFAFTSCYSVHFHNRSVCNYVTQTTESGAITNSPTDSSTKSVNAEKTLDTAVTTDEGTANASKKADNE